MKFVFYFYESTNACNPHQFQHQFLDGHRKFFYSCLRIVGGDERPSVTNPNPETDADHKRFFQLAHFLMVNL